MADATKMGVANARMADATQSVIHSNDQGEEEEEEGLRSVDSGPTQTGKKGALLDLRSFSVILQVNALTTTIFKTRQAD